MAKRTRDYRLTSLNHYLDRGWFAEAFRKLKRQSAPGLDKVTVKRYEANLPENIKSLIEEAKSGNYKAPPVKRVHIPKGNKGETRPIGIPVTEDKLLQRAVLMLLEPIYENDFLECSYGFRPSRSPHQALHKIWQTLMNYRGGWVLDVDIRKYFDSMDHSHIRAFLRQRVNDGVVLRLIDKWLKAGVMDKGIMFYPDEGTPQGGVISPFLSNVYLHHVLDYWVETTVKTHLSGPMELVRFADDFVLIFKYREDAERVQNILPKRLGRFGLAIHPDKTRLVRFEPPDCIEKGENPVAFNFLGFTHYWGRSRKGTWVVKRKTAKDRLNRAMKEINVWCRNNRHLKISVQCEKLVSKLRGHYNYYGINGNFRSLSLFLHSVKRFWRYWLNRRNRENTVPWQRFVALMQRYPLPTPRIAHSIC